MFFFEINPEQVQDKSYHFNAVQNKNITIDPVKPSLSTHSAFSVEELFEKIELNSGFRPTLGIIFSSVALGIPHLAEQLKSSGFPVFGSSTAGEILVHVDDSPMREQSCVCCLMDLDPSHFSVRLFEKGSDSGFDLGTQIGEWGSSIFTTPAFIIALSGLKTDAESVITGIASACPADTPLYGGIAGDDSEFKNNYVFSEQGHSTNGVVVLVLDRLHADISGIATSGWAGVGSEMIATGSEGNVLFSLNGRPAVDIVREYLSVSNEELVQVGVNFPFLVRRPDGSEVLRTFLSADFNEGSLTFGGTIPKESHVRFSSSFGPETIAKSIDDLRAFHRSSQTADLVLVFSCMARHRAAGRLVNDEINEIARLWKAPAIGFFTYGEIGHTLHGKSDFYNENLCTVLLNFSDGSP